jgi:hypothetical protein
MRRSIATALRFALVAFLAFCLAAQLWIVPSTAARVADAFPEAGWLVQPAICWCIGELACAQVLALIGLRLIPLVRDREFTAPAYGWLWAVVAIFLLFFSLLGVAYVTLTDLEYTPPTVMLGIVLAGALSFGAALTIALYLATRPGYRSPA